MLRVAGRAGVVRGEQAWIAKPVVHGAKVSGPGKDIVARLVRVRPEAVGGAHLAPGPRHELHQPHGSSAAPDRSAVERGPPSALRAHDAPDPFLRDAETRRCSRDERTPSVDLSGGRTIGQPAPGAG